MDFLELMDKRGEICSYCSGLINISNSCSESCPLSSKNNGKSETCGNFILGFPKEAQEIISSWKKPVDWFTIPVDTKILVRDFLDSEWSRAYFAEYKDGKVYAFDYGSTSWSVHNDFNKTSWKYAKLYKEDEDTIQ